MIADHLGGANKKADAATPEDSSAVRQKEDAMSDIARWAAFDGGIAPHPYGKWILYDDHQAEVERLTAERDAAQAEVERLIAERDQSESRPKGREVGRFGLDGHYLDAMQPTRPSDEDIWREAFMVLLRKTSYAWERASEEADRVLAQYRKRWPR